MLLTSLHTLAIVPLTRRPLGDEIRLLVFSQERLPVAHRVVQPTVLVCFVFILVPLIYMEGQTKSVYQRHRSERVRPITTYCTYPTPPQGEEGGGADKIAATLCMIWSLLPFSCGPLFYTRYIILRICIRSPSVLYAQNLALSRVPPWEADIIYLESHLLSDVGVDHRILPRYLALHLSTKTREVRRHSACTRCGLILTFDFCLRRISFDTT